MNLAGSLMLTAVGRSVCQKCQNRNKGNKGNKGQGPQQECHQEPSQSPQSGKKLTSRHLPSTGKARRPCRRQTLAGVVKQIGAPPKVGGLVVNPRQLRPLGGY
mmetsp:Transcript_21525/g.48566  ORF Transcript_21525/g.48566 Transcript_21525/m.48566 type:complete len:103 (+) Transcript_21525:222-530(+)